MKLVKSLLLGSAAGLAAVAGAQAADLPVRKAAPVEYVRVCSTYGAGFFYIPGTETCLRVGGRVRAEFGYVEPAERGDDITGFRARGRINIDSRTATAYGLLRAFARYELTRNTGSFGSDSTSLSQAFVQFGGLTAGRALSFFYNPDITNANMGTIRFYDFVETNLFAYTFSFGNGFSASLAAESGDARRLDNAFGMDYAGEAMPDVVANLKYSSTWGSAQLSGAVHQLRALDADVDTEYGFAVGFQGTLNLPMLAPGDSLWLAAAYADGALSYLGFGDTVTVGRTTGQVVDAYIDAAGNLDKGRGWQVAGGLNHFWTPQIRQGVFGSYARVNYGSDAPATISDFNEWRVGTNVVWQPVSGLDLGVEVLYSNLDPRGPAAIRSDDTWEGRIRVQRDF